VEENVILSDLEGEGESSPRTEEQESWKCLVSHLQTKTQKGKKDSRRLFMIAKRRGERREEILQNCTEMGKDIRVTRRCWGSKGDW